MLVTSQKRKKKFYPDLQGRELLVRAIEEIRRERDEESPAMVLMNLAWSEYQNLFIECANVEEALQLQREQGLSQKSCRSLWCGARWLVSKFNAEELTPKAIAQNEKLKPLHDALLKWSAEMNLRENWFLEFGLQTLDEWIKKTPDSIALKASFRFKTIQVDVGAWFTHLQTWTEYLKDAQIEFDQAMEQYRILRERQTLQDTENRIKHAKWTALTLRGESGRAIGAPYNVSSQGVNSEVHKFAKGIGLKLKGESSTKKRVKKRQTG